MSVKTITENCICFYGWVGFWSLVQLWKSWTSSLWCVVFLTGMIAPATLVQQVLDLGVNISWRRHLSITVWIVFYLLKIDLYIDTLDQLVLLCFLDRFCVSVSWWCHMTDISQQHVLIWNWHPELPCAVYTSVQPMNAKFELFSD